MTSSSSACADGTNLELFGSASAADGAWLSRRTRSWRGFLWETSRPRARTRASPGVDLLGELRVIADGYAWQHSRAPDGHVYELTASRRPWTDHHARARTDALARELPWSHGRLAEGCGRLSRRSALRSARSR